MNDVNGTPRPMSVLRNDSTPAELPEYSAVEERNFCIAHDEEFQPALHAVGLIVGHEADATLAQQTAAATLAMKRMKALRHAVDELEAIREMEKAGIDAMADRAIRPLLERHHLFGGWVLALSELIEWGKKKSHDTPFGSFGTRASAKTYRLTDPLALAAWAVRTESPHVTVALTVPLSVAKERFTDAEIAEWGELSARWGALKKELQECDALVALPDGVEAVPEKKTPFVKIS